MAPKLYTRYPSWERMVFREFLRAWSCSRMIIFLGSFCIVNKISLTEPAESQRTFHFSFFTVTKKEKDLCFLCELKRSGREYEISRLAESTKLHKNNICDQKYSLQCNLYTIQTQTLPMKPYMWNILPILGNYLLFLWHNSKRKSIFLWNQQHIMFIGGF